VSHQLVVFMIGVCVFACAAAFGGYLESLRYADLKEECRKQHNVYECAIVAVPKGKEGVYK